MLHIQTKIRILWYSVNCMCIYNNILLIVAFDCCCAGPAPSAIDFAKRVAAKSASLSHSGL